MTKEGTKGDDEIDLVGTGKVSPSTVSTSMSPTETDTFETTNLLFGDNLALLYAQGAPKEAKSNIATKDDSIANEGKECAEEVPDLLWS